MGFFYKLFNGEICPIENLVRQTPEYTKALHELAAASEKLEKSLTPEQSDLFYAMKNAKAEVETLLQAEAYRMGFIGGLEMKKDIETNGKAAD